MLPGIPVPPIEDGKRSYARVTGGLTLDRPLYTCIKLNLEFCGCLDQAAIRPSVDGEILGDLASSHDAGDGSGTLYDGGIIFG